MLIGDILLVTGESKLSASLVLAQKAIYGKAISSHVALSLGDGTFVHATGDGGVHITFIIDELKTCSAGWRAIRLKGITEEQQDALCKSGLYFLRQGYNRVFMGSGNDHSSFCSELVAKAYKQAGVQIFPDKDPSKITPAHFDQAADEQGIWEDVTAECIERLKEIESDQFPYRFACDLVRASMAKRHFMSAARKNMFDLMQAMSEAEGNPRMSELVDEAKQSLRDNRSLHFWDEKDQN